MLEGWGSAVNVGHAGHPVSDHHRTKRHEAGQYEDVAAECDVAERRQRPRQHDQDADCRHCAPATSRAGANRDAHRRDERTEKQQAWADGVDGQREQRALTQPGKERAEVRAIEIERPATRSIASWPATARLPTRTSQNAGSAST